MISRFTLTVLIASLVLSATAAFAQSTAQTERIEASFVLALGRAPSAADIAEMEKQGALTISELVARHRQQLQNDVALQRTTAIKAWKDAFGRAPTETEIARSLTGNRTYTELMQAHIQWLAENPAEYEKVMERGYRLVIRRGVYPGEIAYWKKRNTLPFALLVGCIEDWGRRNAPGLMETTGTATVSINSNYLETVRLSPVVAIEARVAAGLTAAGTADFLSASGRNLVSAGATTLMSSGRIHFAATGGSNLVPAESAN
jgi:hypothetical protein